MKLAVAVVLAALAFACAARPAQEPVARPQAAPYIYHGTVRAVESQPPSLTLLTGVGLALRLVAIRILPESRFGRAGAALTLGDFQPGDVVRAECRLVAGALVADRIEKVETPR